MRTNWNGAEMRAYLIYLIIIAALAWLLVAPVVKTIHHVATLTP
jgi:hypothetical protein